MPHLNADMLRKSTQTDLKDLEIGDFPIFYIDTESKLAALVRRLGASKWLAIDTEFIREKTYYPQLCLMQIATEEFAACIDPLKLKNIDLLLNIIFDDAKIKIMHAGRQDMEILFYLRESVPQNIFDTQLAAPFLGYAEQISYAALVAAITGLKINKSQTRTDWRVRPLTSDQLIYAASDVYHLAQVYLMMNKRLEEPNRLAWLQEEYSKLLDY